MVTVIATATGGAGGTDNTMAVSKGKRASVTLVTNGAATDAVGGGTTGTLNLTQSAIGGSGGSTGLIGGSGGDASSILSGDNPSERSPTI